MEDVAATIFPVSKESAMIVTFSGSCLGHKISGIYIPEILIMTVQKMVRYHFCITGQLTLCIVKVRLKRVMPLIKGKWLLVVMIWVLMAGGTKVRKEGKKIAQLLYFTPSNTCIKQIAMTWLDCVVICLHPLHGMLVWDTLAVKFSVLAPTLME